MGRIRKGMIVHWDDDPKDRGVVFEEDDGSFTVLWFDAECYCDMLDANGMTEWKVEPKGGQSYSERSGMIHDSKGRFVRPGQHFVIPTGSIELDTLAWARNRFNRDAA